MKGHALNLGLALGLALAILVLIVGILGLIGVDVSSLIIFGALGAGNSLVALALNVIVVFVNGLILGGLIGYFLDLLESK